MKIRTLIFLFVTAIGLFPLLLLVALNLPKTIERLERAAELESQAISQIRFTQLNARIRCLKKSIIRAATLPSALQPLVAGTDTKGLARVLERWFEGDSQVNSICLFDTGGHERLSLTRKEGVLTTVFHDRNPSNQDFFKQTLLLHENQIVVKLVSTRADDFQLPGDESQTLLMSTPVFDNNGEVAGLMVMRADLTRFLQDYQDAYWVTNNGKILKGCREQDDRFSATVVEDEKSGCSTLQKLPAFHDRQQQEDAVILQDTENTKIAWLPLIFNEDDSAVMWVGTGIDESATRKWKLFLLINVVAVILGLSIVVYISASWIAGHIDRIRRDLLQGLDVLINEEKPVRFQWKGPLEIKSLARDLTEFSRHYRTTCEARNAAELALRESEDTFRNLTASALDGIILMDKQGNVAYWNEAATNIFGYLSQDVLSKPIHGLLNLRRVGEDQGLVRLDQMDRKENIAHTLELTAEHIDGHDVIVELSLSSARIKKQWYAIWIVRDISERKRSEERARQQQQQLLHADKMISLGLLVSGVAHEINNPNSIALLNLPLLARAWESVKPVLDEYYEENGDFTVAGLEYTEMRQQLPRLCVELEESAGRIRQIVMDLKDYARQETSGLFQHVDVNEVVQSSIRLTTNSVQKATTRFQVEYEDTLPPVDGNRQRLIQVVINLIQNSCEALAGVDGGLKVQTCYNPEVDAVEILVKDEGSGIDADLLGKVTDPFFTTKRNIGGTGLGLSVSAGIVKEHHGLLSFSSQPGQGTEVKVSLPAVHEQSEGPV